MNFLSRVPKKEGPAEQEIKGLIYDDYIQVISPLNSIKLLLDVYMETLSAMVFELWKRLSQDP
jgi:hypothetical protein